MFIDRGLADVLIALITAIGSYLGGFRHGRSKYRKYDIR